MYGWWRIRHFLERSRNFNIGGVLDLCIHYSTVSMGFLPFSDISESRPRSTGAIVYRNFRSSIAKMLLKACNGLLGGHAWWNIFTAWWIICGSQSSSLSPKMVPRGFSANRCGVEWCLCILWEGFHRPSLCHACYASGILTGQTRWVIWQSPTQDARANCVELCSGVGGWTQGSSISAHCSW